MVVQLVLFWSLSQHEQFIRFLQWKNSCWLIRFSRFLFPYIFVSHLFFMKTGASHIDVLFFRVWKNPTRRHRWPQTECWLCNNQEQVNPNVAENGVDEFRLPGGGGPEPVGYAVKNYIIIYRVLHLHHCFLAGFRNNPSILGSQNWPHFFLEQCLEVMILFPIANW